MYMYRMYIIHLHVVDVPHLCTEKLVSQIWQLVSTEYCRTCTCTCSDYKEYHTDTTVRFVITMTPEMLAAAERDGMHKYVMFCCTKDINFLV